MSWGLGEKKNNYLHKNINVISNAWNLNFKLSKIQGPIQVLVNTLDFKKINQFSFWNQWQK
jgi:hypothetical protein